MENNRYLKYYQRQIGGGGRDNIGEIISIPYFIQKGSGIGSVFGSLISRYLIPTIKGGLDMLKNQSINTGVNVLSDLIQQHQQQQPIHFKEIIKRRGKEALQDLKQTAHHPARIQA